MKPKIIAVAATKGGVGKTTIALQLAIARAKKGKEVWLIDGDRQQTAVTALTLRDSQKVKPGIACASYPDGQLLLSQVKLQKDKWDTIIIDVGGFDSSTLRAAPLICDVLLVPFQPRSFDLWGVSAMSKLVQEATSARRGRPFKAYAVLNSAETTPGSSENSDSIEALQDFPELTFLETKLCRRKAFATSSGFGMGVMELKVKDKKAIAELAALAEAVFAEWED